MPESNLNDSIHSLVLDCVLEERMTGEAKGDPEIERMQGIPGVGPKVSFAFTSYVDFRRFENGAQVANYDEAKKSTKCCIFSLTKRNIGVNKEGKKSSFDLKTFCDLGTEGSIHLCGYFFH
jgi:hypothetical protein